MPLVDAYAQVPRIRESKLPSGMTIPMRHKSLRSCYVYFILDSDIYNILY